jgi:hypothetical protein
MQVGGGAVSRSVCADGVNSFNCTGIDLGSSSSSSGGNVDSEFVTSMVQ